MMETANFHRGTGLTRHTIYFLTSTSILGLALFGTPAVAAQDDLYFGLSILGSQLEPETENTQYTITENNDSGYKVFFGYDLRNAFGLEASFVDLGESELTGPRTGTIAYEAWNLTGRLYFPFNQVSGARAFLKTGFGDLDVSSNNIDFNEEEGIQATSGLGVEWLFRNGFTLRGEYDYYDDDAQAVSLGISKRFSLGSKRAMPIVDSDGDGISNANDHCANTPKGTPVLPNGCHQTKPVMKLSPPKDSDGDGIQDSSDQCPNTVKGLMVDLKGCPADADGDGIANAIDQCANTAAGSAVASNGCPPVPAPAPLPVVTAPASLDSDGDGISDAIDRCPNTAADTPVDARGCGTKSPVRTGVLDGVRFVTGSILLTEASKQTLNRVAAALNQQPDSKVMVVGHTDNVGSAAFNFQLSTNRARAVAGYLASRGVSPSRLRFLGKGEENPIANNNTKAGRAMNRRVVVIVSG